MDGILFGKVLAVLISRGVPFSWKSAAGNGKPVIPSNRTSRMSVVGAESDDEPEFVGEPYEPSIADTEDLRAAVDGDKGYTSK